MSTVYLTIENITDEDEMCDTYSIIDNMNCYRVAVAVWNDSIFTVYDQEDNVVKDEALADMLIDQVVEFRKGE